MRAYELMLILDGGLEESPAHAWVNQATKMIEAAGGSVVGKPDWWGRRRYAYEINHKWEGYYAVFHVLAEGGALDGVERSFRLADDVVRHKLLRLPDHEAARRGLIDAAS
jgi:small subunit ribosomal protein S6